MKDWDRKHSEEFSRRLSLGQPALVPVTPDVPADGHMGPDFPTQLDKEHNGLPIVLTPDPPPEPAVSPALASVVHCGAALQRARRRAWRWSMLEGRA